MTLFEIAKALSEGKNDNFHILENEVTKCLLKTLYQGSKIYSLSIKSDDSINRESPIINEVYLDVTYIYAMGMSMLPRQSFKITARAPNTLVKGNFYLPTIQIPVSYNLDGTVTYRTTKAPEVRK